MKELLRRIHVIDDIHVELDIQKNEFVNNLNAHLDEGSMSVLTDSVDVFTPNNKKYKGHVTADEFKIKLRRKFFDPKMNISIATGGLTQHGDILEIKGEVNGWNGLIIPFYIFLLCVYLVFLGWFLYDRNLHSSLPPTVIPILVAHLVFAIGAPYYLMRKSTKTLKEELEQDFPKIAKNQK